MKEKRVYHLSKYIEISKMFVRYFNLLSFAYSNQTLNENEYEHVCKDDLMFLIKSIISYNQKTTRNNSCPTSDLNCCITHNREEYYHAIKTIEKVLSKYTPNQLLILLFKSKESREHIKKLNDYEWYTTYDELLEDLFENNKLLIRFFNYGARRVITRRQFWYDRKINFLESM